MTRSTGSPGVSKRVAACEIAWASRFVTSFARPGSQEVDGSIPFSSTILH
jgi:hypothetical protein